LLRRLLLRLQHLRLLLRRRLRKIRQALRPRWSSQRRRRPPALPQVQLKAEEGKNIGALVVKYECADIRVLKSMRSEK
jgi:hypothetical protein